MSVVRLLLAIAAIDVAFSAQSAWPFNYMKRLAWTACFPVKIEAD